MQLRVLTAALLVTACSPKSADSDGDGTGSSTVQTDGASVTSATGTPASDTIPTTDPGPGGMTTTTTTASQTASSSASDSASVTGAATDTGGTGEGGLPGACAKVCARWDECAPGSAGPLDECAAKCVDGFQEPPECAAAMAAQWECVAALACEEALKFLNGTPSSCLAEVQATDAACSDIPCGGEVGGDMQTCMLMQECGNGSQEYACDGETCTCSQDGVPGKQCPDDGFCALDFEAQRAAITACCGWEWQA